jgi:hypothetical protein
MVQETIILIAFFFLSGHEEMETSAAAAATAGFSCLKILRPSFHFRSPRGLTAAMCVLLQARK